MKRKAIWKELNLPPPAKKPTSPTPASDPGAKAAAQQALRQNCVRTLSSALSTPGEGAGGSDPGADSGPHRSQEDTALRGLADAIERELFRHHSSEAGQEYKAAARTLVASLKRNSELRQRVVGGQVPPAALVAMDARELATAAQREEYARLQEAGTRRVTLAGRGAATVTSDYACGRCGGRSCDYLDSGRRDIGKCETWGSKDGQGVSRLVTCLGCGHRWEVDDV